MKRCPRCGRIYKDTAINFCLDDGELLGYLADDAPETLFRQQSTAGSVDDSPPTVFMDRPRVTSEGNWQSSSPPAWSNQGQNVANRPFSAPAFIQSRDQTLPTVAMVLGIISLLLVCCYGGLWLGLPAAIVGYLGMRNADNHPDKYMGRGMAIAGIALGAITFLISVVHVLFIIISILAS